MIAPLVLLMASLACAVAALILPGWADMMLLAAPCALASFYLLVRAYFGRRQSARQEKLKWILVDGSNVMHWRQGTPRIETVREVVRHLTERGFRPAVVFDANAGYLILGSYKHDGAMGKLLGLPRSRAMVVPKGTPADPFILAAARDYGAQVVTNDRFRDWAEDYPEVLVPGHLIRGGYHSGTLWTDLGQA